MPSSMDEPVSHGRGGAANIQPDSAVYTDGEIVREGPVGDQGDGAYSAGRGGAGNIESPGLKPTNQAGTTGDHDVIPETAMRNSGDSGTYHVGRGGEGNVHKDMSQTTHVGLADKLKNKILGKK